MQRFVTAKVFGIVMIASLFLLIIMGCGRAEKATSIEERTIKTDSIGRWIKQEPAAPVRLKPDPRIQKLKFTPRYAAAMLGVRQSGVFRVTNRYHSENTAQAIAPGTCAACPNGRAVFSSSRVEPELSVFPVWRDLYDVTGRFDPNAVAVTTSTFPCETKQHELGDDNLLIKLKDGSLMAIRQGGTWETVSPKPSWWYQVRINNKPLGTRVPEFVFRSTDCGETWERLSIIDPIDFEDGRYARPRPGENAFGGFNRPEAYADPWTGYVYVSVNAAWGPLVDYSTGQVLEDGGSTHIVLQSTDGGKTWKIIFKFREPVWTPIVMTSTPNGRLCLFTRGATASGETEARLYYSKLGSQSLEFIGPKPIYYVLGDGAEGRMKLRPETDLKIYYKLVFMFTNSVSRISTDTTSSKVRLS
jgi:hypothetical protein